MEILKKLVLGAAVCFLGFLVYAVPLTERSREAANALADEFYNRYNSGDFAYIHANMLAAGLKAAVAPEDIAAARAKTGRLKGRRPASFKLLRLDGGRLYLRFDAEYEKLAAQDQFYLAREGGALKLQYTPNDQFPCRSK